MSRGEVGSNVESLHRKWSSDTDYLSAYEELGGPEFEIARAVILARQGAGLTQGQLAKRMNTTQSVIARLEGGRTCPSTTTPMRFAQATGTRLKISFEAADASASRLRAGGTQPLNATRSRTHRGRINPMSCRQLQLVRRSGASHAPKMPAVCTSTARPYTRIVFIRHRGSV